MAERPESEKVTIASEDGNKQVVCQFNPTEFQISREIAWRDLDTQGKNTPKKVFAGGKPNDLEVTLLFDTTSTGDDVRDSYETLLELARIDEQSKNTTTQMGEPPVCLFQWGTFLSFAAVIKQVTQKFKLFKADGTPLRAEVTVKFSQIQEETRGQNPTTRSEPRKTWVVRQGDRLDWISYKEYGDAAHWRHIAETNGLTDPTNLSPGQVLKLVPLP